MTKQVIAVISLLIFATLTLVAARSWRSRISSQSAEFDEPLEALEYFGELIAQGKGFYVATTYSVNHLERIAAYGLGSRGVASVFVFTEGILIVRTGERPLAINRAQIIALESVQFTIDKAVEPGGLLAISWLQGTTGLSTQIRIVESKARSTISSAILEIIASNNKRKVNR